MPFTRSRNTSGAPLAVGRDGVALRRSSRTSSAPSTASSSTIRPVQPLSSPSRELKSLSKARNVARPPSSVYTERESSSFAELAPTVASRARSSLSRFRGDDAAPAAAFAVVDASTNSPFLKRTPLFIQRHVHLRPALLLGAALSPSRLVLAATPSLSPPASSATSFCSLSSAQDATAASVQLRARTKRARSSSGSSVGTPSPRSDGWQRDAESHGAARRRVERTSARADDPARVEQVVERDVCGRRDAASSSRDMAVARLVRQSSIALSLIVDGE